MTETLYYILCSLLTLMVLGGIAMMSRVQTARLGNMLSALSMLLGILLSFAYYEVFSATEIYLFILVGSALGLMLALRVKMIEIPQLVAVLNGLGGGASALVGILALRLGLLGLAKTDYPTFAVGSSMLAILIGMMTLIGSLVAAGKLHKLLPQRPVVYPGHSLWANLCVGFGAALVVLSFFGVLEGDFYSVLALIILSALFGWLLAIRVGGADMPITISLLNSFSGLAGAIAGMATGDLLLISIGGVVGASGLLLTQIMCRAMNRSLMSILLGTGIKSGGSIPAPAQPSAPEAKAESNPKPQEPEDALQQALQEARNVIIVPGYGMALSQAQHELRSLADKLRSRGANVRYAI
ncbi:NAD(P)(+) transhydrogenase (Re/Si-specific) subunit beta, partial [Porphyromonas sp. COT-239 OH1446]|uniref:NAD(P)(+) transhydrogenase (Re/Si-specific) subunit beta n=1 Tax=Porphyromonas sp. COT-239 OH1446 TaxID=1515613 RepID=UPI00052C6C01